MKPNQARGLAPIEQHNQLTCGPFDWTNTRIDEQSFQLAKAVFGTSSREDDKRVYQTLQAFEWSRTHPVNVNTGYLASNAKSEPAAPEGFELVAVKGFSELMYWLERCDSKGHLDNCSDLLEPWANFDYRTFQATTTGEQP